MCVKEMASHMLSIATHTQNATSGSAAVQLPSTCSRPRMSQNVPHLLARLGPCNVWQLEAPLQTAAPLPRTTNFPERQGETPSAAHQPAHRWVLPPLAADVQLKTPLTGENQVSFFFSLALHDVKNHMCGLTNNSRLTKSSKTKSNRL